MSDLLVRRVAVLGATGSIGGSALDVIARHPQRYRATVLTANHNVGAMVKLCRHFKPELAVMADANSADALRKQLDSERIQTRVESGPNGLIEAAASDLSDTVIAAIVGGAGLESTLAAARAGKRLLLANKEAIVMAGPLLLAALAEGGGELLPIDSEHNAIFQCLPLALQERAARPGIATRSDYGVTRLLLTASGGPFRGRTADQLVSITPGQACAHPNWDMGRKISVDSATLMNKGLEVIEAHHLFGIPADAIDVVVHRQSIIHSLVQYRDGSMLAQLGNPDMRTALAYGLAWPERIDAGVAPLDLLAVGRLDFEAVDRVTFRCLDLAYAALRAGGTATAVLNAANEEAVAAFLDRGMKFLDIANVIEETLDNAPGVPMASLDALLDADLTARRDAARIIAAKLP
ncbi:MAG: 1-deoxy-D-xylulose-5-phosphate reductoisomerase [Dokdonella sp.]